MTTKIASAYFLCDPKKQPIKIIYADTGIQTLVVPESDFVLTGEFPTVIAAELQGGPIATLLEFGFLGMPEAVITVNEVRVKVPLATDLTQLVPVYNTGSPQVTGKPASGVPNNFSTPQTYTVMAGNGSPRRYSVTVIPTRGAVAITNPGFEKFDAAIDTESKPGGAAWHFIKPSNNGELGIRDLVEEPSAPRPPDGSRYAVFMRGVGNGISQPIMFDTGTYTLSFDAVKRRGYEKAAASLKVTLDEVTVMTLEPSAITEAWASYQTPAFVVTAGVHTLAITLGEGGGMDLVDNLVLRFEK
jgi:hypothetical protein